VYPRESEWFGAYDEHGKVVMMKDQKMYAENWFGLKTLYEAGKMFFYSGEGDHMHLTQDYVNDFLVPLLTD